MIHRPLLYTRTQRRCTCSRKGLHLFPSKKLSCLLSCFCWVCVSWLPITTTGPVSRTQPAACKNTNKLYRTLHLHLCFWQMMSQSDLQDDVKKNTSNFYLFVLSVFVCLCGGFRSCTLLRLAGGLGVVVTGWGASGAILRTSCISGVSA